MSCIILLIMGTVITFLAVFALLGLFNKGESAKKLEADLDKLKQSVGEVEESIEDAIRDAWK